MDRLKVKIEVPLQSALARGVGTYGKGMLEPSDQELAALTPGERELLLSDRVWRIDEPTWSVLASALAAFVYNELIEAAKKDAAREAKCAAVVEAIKQLRFDDTTLDVLCPVLPHYVDAPIWSEYRATIDRLTAEGLERADREVNSVLYPRADGLERARQIIGKRRDSPRSKALIEAEAERVAELRRTGLRSVFAGFATAEQLERFDARVLPDSELRSVLNANIWPDLPRYVPLTSEDVTRECEDGERDVSDVRFWDSEASGTFSAEEWQDLKRVKQTLASVVPDATWAVRCHWASRVSSYHEVHRLGVRASVEIGGHKLEREYALGS